MTGPTPTDADRERAAETLVRIHNVSWNAAEDELAAALAAVRAESLAPVLALADELEQAALRVPQRIVVTRIRRAAGVPAADTDRRTT